MGKKNSKKKRVAARNKPTKNSDKKTRKRGRKNRHSKDSLNRGKPKKRGGQRQWTGTFSGNARGFGFVRLNEAKEDMPDLFIPPAKVRGAYTGDLVRVRILPEKKARFPKRADLGPRGEIIEIIERKKETLIGVFRENSNSELPWVEVRLEGFPDVYISEDKDEQPEVKEGDLVTLEIIHYPLSPRDNPFGKIIENLGVSGDPRTEEKAIILKHHLRDSLPKPVLEEADRCPKKITESMITGERRDLRDLCFFTIDGETARDFDDAVYIEAEETGNYRLFVVIADVAHYVLPGSEIDKEAYRRATSVYFPTRALHMLPENLSAGICSLVPDEDRFVQGVEILFDSNGKRKDAKFFEAVFRSKARLTYREVEHVLVDEHFATNEPKHHPLSDKKIKQEVEKRLLMMKQLHHLLYLQRKKRGSLEFEIPEAEIVFEGDGFDYSVEDIVRGMRQSSHKLIEEFMVAANEAVSEYLGEHKLPIPYRIHDLPDELKIRDFIKVINKIPEIDGELKKSLEKDNWKIPGVLANLLVKVHDLPQSRLVNQMLLTSLRLAIYHTENREHFGLASTSYSHFTSPIRRYPDLILHRILKTHLRQERVNYTKSKVQEHCDHCSAQEQIAVTAEREIIQFFKVLFMKKHLGKEFPGIIVRVTAYGFFVELLPYFVDGFLPIENLSEDDYGFDPERQVLKGKNNSYGLGDEMKVQVAEIDLERRRITFALA